MDVIRQIVEVATLVIGGVGVAIVIWGSLVTVFEVLPVEFKKLRGKKNICRDLVIVRHHLGIHLLLGLEFFIAADILRTILKPSLQDVAVLGAIVAIRTVISFFLDREMQQVV